MRLVTIAVLFCACCTSAARQNNLSKNKRIIKVRVPPRQHPDFYNGPKGYLRPSGSPIRFKEHNSKHNEFIRPNHPAFYSSYKGNAYVKHQSRPPPPSSSGIQGFSFSGPGFGPTFKGYHKEIYQKFPLTYGSSFPHKTSFSSFKFPSVKDEIHITHNQAPATAASLESSSSSSSASSSLGSSSLYGSSHESKSQTSSFQQPTSYYVSSPHAHVQPSDDNRGPIKEIPAPDLGPKPVDSLEYLTYGKGPSIDVTNLVSDVGSQQLTFPTTQYYSAFGHENNFDVISGNHISTATVYAPGLYRDADASGHDSSSTVSGYSASSSVSGDNLSSSVSGLKASSSISGYDTSSSVSDSSSAHASVTPVPTTHSTGYEVTEETVTAAGHSGTGSLQFYYAPDPDPSLPVHKVPQTKELYTEQKLAEAYVPQVTQNFQILEGGSVAAPLTTLSSGELFQLVHGFSQKIPIVQEPVVAVLGQPGAVYLQQTYPYAVQNEAQQSVTHQEYVQQQQAYVPQDQYQNYYTQAGQVVQNYNAEESGNHEPVASESRKRGSLMKMDGDDAAVAGSASDRENQIYIHFNKIPEVPFYTTLPNKQAAEALATLQAAGSIGSNYVEQLKANREEPKQSFDDIFEKLRGDQGPETGDDAESDLDFSYEVKKTPPLKVELNQDSDGALGQENVRGVGAQRKEVPDVEVQKSIPIYEASYASSSLLDDAGTAANTVKTEPYGLKIKPK